jgi:hypothetical protein
MQSSPAKTRLLTALLLAVIFGSGFTLGLAVHRTAVATPADEDTEIQPEEEPRTPMYERVGPTEDQSVLIDSIVVDFRAKMESLQEQFRSEYNPRYEALIDSTRGAIKDVFSAEQAAQYDSLIADYERRRAKERQDSLQAAGDDRN